MKQTDKTRFCSECNHGMSLMRIEQSKYDFPCPNCNRCSISNFYSIGSYTHKEQIQSYFEYRDYKMGKIIDKISPPSLPTVKPCLPKG